MAASGQPWVPPGWKGPTGGRGGRGRGVAGRDSHGAYPPDLQAELERVRRSFEDVCRERDVLRSHVSKMESLIHERVGAQFRSSSAPRAGTSSAPATPKGGSGSSASLGGRPGSASPKAKKLTKEAELEFLRRQQRYGWAPDRSSKLSGVEQLKKHLEAAEKKALEATTKVKIKRYQTKAELEEATKAMFERGAPDTARDHTRSAASERRRAECPPPPHTHTHIHTLEGTPRLQVCLTAHSKPHSAALKHPVRLLCSRVLLAAKNSRAKLDAFVEKKHEEERQQYTATCKKLSISARERAIRLQQMSMPLRKPPPFPPKAIDVVTLGKPPWNAGRPKASSQPGSAREKH